MGREKLKQARKGKDMTQQAMADYLYISLSHYKNIEYGIRQGSIELWDRLEALFMIHQKKLREVSHSPSAQARSP